MLEIEQKVVANIENDSGIDTLLNPSEADNRIYTFYPHRDVEYNSTNRSAIFYFSRMPKRNYKWSYPYQMPNIFFYFRVLSINPLELRQISEKLINLFDNTSLQTDNWSVKWIEIKSYTDGESEGGPSNVKLVKNLSFDFTNVFKRG